MQSKSLNLIASLGIVMTVSGCSTIGMDSLTSSDTSNVATASPDSAATSPDKPGSGGFVRGTCPEVQLRTGTAFYRTYARGGTKDQDPSKVVRQASLYDTTRSCSVSGNQVNMNVAAAGRIVAGPAGGPGSVTMPVRVAVVDDNGKVIYSQLTPYKAELPSGSATNQFLFKKTVSIPLSAAGSAKAYVGFDEGAHKTH